MKPRRFFNGLTLKPTPASEPINARVAQQAQPGIVLSIQPPQPVETAQNELRAQQSLTREFVPETANTKICARLHDEKHFLQIFKTQVHPKARQGMDNPKRIAQK